MEYNATGKVTCLLADLGFSSMQVDNPSRGFSYKLDGPLDMRMNREGKSETAAVLLSRISTDVLNNILIKNAEEPYSNEIAKCIFKSAPVQSTFELTKAVKAGCILAHNNRRLPPPTKDDIGRALARTAQALRVEVNQEFVALDNLLKSLPSVLAPGGRVVILTFHSGEDRRVKKAFKKGFNDGIFSSWSRDVVTASPRERMLNPRSKCCKLRWAVRA